MEYTTEQYRQEMRLPYRGKSHVYVYLGLINEDAQRSAHITSSFDGSEEHLYDGSAASSYVTSTESDGSITFEFEGFENNIAGLQITLGTPLPNTITVTNGTKEETYTVNGKSDFSFDDGYTNCHELTLIPDSGKLKIKSITFGIGLQFGDRQLLSTTRTNIVNHISNDLPSKKFAFNIDNRAHLFNKDNPYGYADYVQEKQEVTYEYGRELSDGSLYKIKGGKVYLQRWSSNDYEALFTCIGSLENLDGQFYKGQYYEDGESAYNIAQFVFEDAGITNYKLDPSLARVQIFNPLPVCSYKEALQMIANASRCTLYEDRDGDICITNASLPSFMRSIEFIGATEYSIESALFDDNSFYNYADAELNYTKADGTQVFLPENESYVYVGFVSSQLANGGGQFTNNPSIYATFKSEYHLYQMFLNFGVVVPTSLTITLYCYGDIVKTDTITDLSVTTVYEYDGTIDAFTIEFNGAQPHQRIHLNNIELEGYIDYELTYHELKDTPVANALERVTKVNVHIYEYAYEETEEGTNHSSYVTITSTPNEDDGNTVSVTTGTGEYGSSIASIEAEIGDNTVILKSPYYDYKVSAGTIKESGAYYLVVTSDAIQTINVYAKPFSVTDNVYTETIHEKGVEKNSSNPLIGSLTMAQQQAKWLRDYYDDDIEYDLRYRGDPILDADDVIYLENHFVAYNEIRIEEETISTSMGMDFSCTLTGRRTWFQTNATMDDAVMGKMLMGEIVLG